MGVFVDPPCRWTRRGRRRQFLLHPQELRLHGRRLVRVHRGADELHAEQLAEVRVGGLLGHGGERPVEAGAVAREQQLAAHAERLEHRHARAHQHRGA